MKFVFLMDWMNPANMDKDTTFIMMWGAHQRGHEVYFLMDGQMTLEDGQLKFHVFKTTPQKDKKQPLPLEAPCDLKVSDVDALFIRRDPPFNDSYLMNTWLLDRAAQALPVINSPAGLRAVNEKVWAAQFTDLVPPTMIGRTPRELLAFISRHGSVVAKPTDGYGGQGIFRLEDGGSNVRVTLETLTHHFKRDIILQKYIPAAETGDKRILLLNGEPLGAVLRVHAPGEHRNNFFAGGRPEPCEITARDKEIIAALKPQLLELGLYFVGIDVLGDYLVEVNVTSPTCLQEMNRLYNQTLEDKIIDFTEKLVANYRPRARIAP